MSESSIGLNADGAGKKVRTLKRTIGTEEVHEEVHNVTDGAGTVVDPRKNVEVTGLVVVGSSALPMGAATETTLALLKARADLLATEATLALIKAKTDNLDAALSTRATGTILNPHPVSLASIPNPSNLDIAISLLSRETTLAALSAKITNPLPVSLSTLLNPHPVSLASLPNPSNLDIAASLLAKETTLGTVHGHVDSIDGKVPVKGQATMANSVPVVLASDQSTTTTGADADSSKKALDVAIVKKHTVKTKVVSCNTSGHNEIVAAVANKKIKVLGGCIIFNGTVSAFWEDGTAAMGGAQPFLVNQGYVLPMTTPELAWLETTAGNALQLNLNATVYAYGWIRYTDDDGS